MANYCNGNWPAVTQIPTNDQAIATYCGSGGAWRVEDIFIIVCYVFMNTYTHTQVSVHKVSIGRVFAFTVYKQTYTHTNVNNCVCVCVCTLYVCPKGFANYWLLLGAAEAKVWPLCSPVKISSSIWQHLYCYSSCCCCLFCCLLLLMVDTTVIVVWSIIWLVVMLVVLV